MMTKRNRSPASAVLVAALVGALLGISAPCAAAGSPIPPENAPSASRQTLASALGTQVQATLSSRRDTAVSCGRGKRLVAASSGYITRATVKTLRVDCYSCCEGSIFFDDFETGNTSGWSATSGE